MNQKVTFATIITCMLFFSGLIINVLAQESEMISIEVKYTNGDIADHNGMKLIVYQDYEKTPILEKNMSSNPDSITVPINHRYKIEVFANGMYGDVEYVELKEESQKINVSIPLSGGIKFNTYFDDGQTPINGAKIVIKSHDGEKWRESKTNDKGETIRYWIQSTNRETDYYIAEVFLGDILAKTVSNIKLQEGLAQDQKIVIPIPKIVEDLITVTVYNSTSQKISKDDGNYSVVLVNTESQKKIESTVSHRGEAYFSNLEAGQYSVHIAKNNIIEENWKTKKITVIGTVNQFEIKRDEIIPEETPEEIGINDMPSCNCIAFRFDDVQDFWLNNVQKAYIEKFVNEKIPLTVGIISSSFGQDQVITESVKSGISKKIIHVANHGIGNIPLTEFSIEEQNQNIIESKKNILKTLGVESKIFIPPQNRYNEDTKQALSNNGYTHLSSSLIHGEGPPYPLTNQTLFRFPEIATTGTYDATQNIFLGISHQETFAKAKEGLEKYGFAVITSHPQEFSNIEDGTYSNKINETQFEELEALFKKIRSENIQMISIDKINLDSERVLIPTWIKNNAGWWADGSIDDGSFVQGIQYLIKEGIMKIPETTQGAGSGTNEIPAWIKNNAGWWASDKISDADFINGIEYLVRNGIITY